MKAAAAPRRPATGRQQPGYREERRKHLEVFVAKKMAARKQSASDQCPEIRSPLKERSNTDFPRKLEQVKPSERRMVKPGNAENIRPAVNKDGKSITFTQSFLKTKTLKEKQMKDEKVKLAPTKEETKPPTKPVLGAYRGRIVQSKINSFRKNSENKDLPEQNKIQTVRPQPSASVPAKTLARPSAMDVRPKRPVIPPVSSQIRPSNTLTKSRTDPATVRRTTLHQQRPVQQKAPPAKPPPKTGAVKNNPVLPMAKTSAPVKTLPATQKNKAAPPLPTASKFVRPKESAEDRKARLAEWRQSKGKVIKRPGTVSLPSTNNVPKEMPAIKTEPEEPQEESRPLYWTTMAEEDEQERFTEKIRQTFGDCQKLIDEGCPREEVLSLLDNQVQTVPEAKKFSGYWECLARLEKRDGKLYKVIAVCEEAVAGGVQPLDQLRAILAEALVQLKPDPEECERKENVEDLKSEELKTEVKEETVETTVKGKKRRGKAKAVKFETTDPSTPEKPKNSESTPQNGDAASSVIRFEIRSTPRLEKMKKLQLTEGGSSIKSIKFLTPVRRSGRLERKSHRLPDMLKDHDPCISGIDQLGDLEDTDPCSSAYIFRKNSALKEVTEKNATKK